MLSEQLLIDRAGNFTASENHKLMAGWEKEKPDNHFEEFNEIYRAIRKLKKKPLVGDVKFLVTCNVTGKLIGDTWAYIQSEKPSQGLVTYAEEKAIESLFNVDESLFFSTVHTRNGEERELKCMELLADETGIDFIHTGDDQIHIHANDIGCTPDGIALDELDLVSVGAEVKCKSALFHSRNLLINNSEDLKNEAFEHFVQVQTSMLVTGAKQWYFANYNPFGKTPQLQFKYIIINRDDKFIKILKERIEIAKKIKSEFIKKINESIKVSQ